jgi:hypothetical protein
MNSSVVAVVKPPKPRLMTSFCMAHDDEVLVQ